MIASSSTVYISRQKWPFHQIDELALLTRFVHCRRLSQPPPPITSPLGAQSARRSAGGGAERERFQRDPGSGLGGGWSPRSGVLFPRGGSPRGGPSGGLGGGGVEINLYFPLLPRRLLEEETLRKGKPLEEGVGLGWEPLLSRLAPPPGPSEEEGLPASSKRGC